MYLPSHAAKKCPLNHPKNPVPGNLPIVTAPPPVTLEVGHAGDVCWNCFHQQIRVIRVGVYPISLEHSWNGRISEEL